MKRQSELSQPLFCPSRMSTKERTSVYPLDLTRLTPICLRDLNASAALQTRRDRKYLLPTDTMEWFLDELSGDAQVLEIDGARTFRYESVYFDTPALQNYLSTARSRPHRFKVRTRMYMDSGACVLEVKQRDVQGRTVKHRTDYDPERRRQLDQKAQSFVDTVVGVESAGAKLQPVLTTRYNRSTLLLPSTNSRVTIDTDLKWVSAHDASIDLPSVVLLETKSDGRASVADRLLWSQQHRPMAISKYATGMAALDPTLPANKWNRVLRDHFGWLPDRSACPLSCAQADEVCFY